MPLDPRTPLLVGVGALLQREPDAARAREPFELMRDALRLAAADAARPELLQQIDEIACPRGFWGYADAGRLIARAVGAEGARTTTAEVGVLQTALFGRAAQAILDGDAEVFAVVGGEAKFRDQQAKRAGSVASVTPQPEGTRPDTVLRPSDEILTEEEVRIGLAMPVTQYAIIENAIRAAEGTSVEAHRDEVAKLWAGMSRAAVDNVHAWTRERVSAEEVRNADGRNRMLAFPYTKRHNSQWNVDQASALLFCSVAKARALAIPPQRWIFPLAVADANHMVPLTRRRALHRAPGFAAAGTRAMLRADCRADDLTHLELYSCFPSAVRVQQRELRLPLDREVTVTGGMAFAGGPLNNFVLQAMVRMAGVLRGDPGSVAAVTAVSGILTKQGVSLWSTEPRGEGFAFEDVSAETAKQLEEVPVAAGLEGPAVIAGYTVLNDAFGHRAVLLCDREDGFRTLAAASGDGFADRAEREELTGARVEVGAKGSARLLA